MSENSPSRRNPLGQKNQHPLRSRLGLFLASLTTLSLACPVRPLRAQSPSLSFPEGSAASPCSPPFWANRGRWTFGAQLGFALENDIPNNVSHIALLIAQPHFGIIVRNFQRSPVRRFTIVGEGILGNAVHPGGRLLGQAILFRLDGKPRGRVVPFFEWGAGALHTRVHTKVPELTGGLQFNPQGGLGVQYFFNPQRAVVFEYRYLHMSNANLQAPNPGFNGSMVSIGFRWLRRSRPVGWQPSRRSRNPFHYLFGGE